MTPTLPDRRMLLVHAHPDDESIQNGVTMARYADEGALVTLVTCTLGEEGEVLVPGLAHLASDREDTLGEHRISELAAAMKILGVTDHRFLGGPGRYRDTGMVFREGITAMVPPEVRKDSFWAADLLDASNDLVPVIRELRPQVLVAYDELGGYGHPDHMQAHRVAMYAATLAGIESHRPDLGAVWDIPKIYWNASSESRMRSGLRALRESGDATTFEGFEPDGALPAFVISDEWITTEINGPEFVQAKMAAMRAHATQIEADGEFFAWSRLAGDEAWAVESYRIVKGTPLRAGDGLETDLFAGVA